MNNESIRQFMGDFMSPENININNWEAFSIQIQNTFPENDHIRESVASINRGEVFVSIAVGH